MGIGGTPFTSVAIERAVELAERHKAKITAVTVVDPKNVCKVGPVPPGASFYAKKMCKNRLEVTHKTIEAAIAELEDRCSSFNVPLSIETETGDPFTLVIDHARYHDLTIFGLRSLFEYQLVKDPEKDLLRLLSNGVRPIIAVSQKFRPINKVMIAYNGSIESANAMQHFVQMNLWPNASLEIVQFDEARGSDFKLLDDAAAYCADFGYSVNTHLIPGKASDKLVPTTRQINADMTVMGKGLRSLLIRRVLGDTLLSTLAQTNRPLFLSQ